MLQVVQIVGKDSNKQLEKCVEECCLFCEKKSMILKWSSLSFNSSKHAIENH